MNLRYFSGCSGIEAASLAWTPLGWVPVAFCEIDPFPSAVLAHHYCVTSPDAAGLRPQASLGPPWAGFRWLFVKSTRFRPPCWPTITALLLRMQRD